MGPSTSLCAEPLQLHDIVLDTSRGYRRRRSSCSVLRIVVGTWRGRVVILTSEVDQPWRFARCSQHPGSLVRMLVVVQEITALRVVLGGLDPVSGHDARERHSDAGSSVQPAGPTPPRQSLAKMCCEVVAVLAQKVVRGALKLVGDFVDDGVNFVLRREGEAMQDLDFEGGAGREGFRLCPVHAGNPALIVATIGILSAVYHHT